MSEKSAQRRQRTWSAFGDIRRKPSDYEVVTHDVNWTLRQGRASAFDENPSSLPNLWMRTYRDLSPLTVDDWRGFRDPEALTYRDYVSLQSEAEAKAQGVLEEYSNANAQSRLSAEWRSTLRRLFTTARYPVHAAQQIHAYFGYMAPSSYITNVAAFTAADLLRRVSLVAYRTRELQLAWPEDGFATGERDVWEKDAAWQPARKAVEYALSTFDWGRGVRRTEPRSAPPPWTTSSSGRSVTSRISTTTRSAGCSSRSSRPTSVGVSVGVWTLLGSP